MKWKRKKTELKKKEFSVYFYQELRISITLIIKMQPEFKVIELTS